MLCRKGLTGNLQVVEVQKEGGGLSDERGLSTAELQTLNFKVPEAFKRDYKVYAAQRGITMLQLLREGFDLSRQKDRSA